MATKKKTSSPVAPKSGSKGRKSLRLHGTIARDLGVAIVSGKYLPGDILNGEIAASDRLSVSRSAYREAVRILSAKGLVESRPKVGTRVSAQEHWHLLDPDVLGWIFEFEPDVSLITSLFELRKVVEPQAAALAASRRSKADLAAMAAALEGMAKHTLAAEEGRRADQDFHATLLRASGNVFLVSLTTGIGAAISWTTIFRQRESPLSRDPLPDHQRVYEAIAASDAKEAHAAMGHLIDLALLDTTNARAAKGKRSR